MGTVAARYVQHADGRRVRLLPCRREAREECLVVHRGDHAFVLLNKFPYASGT